MSEPFNANTAKSMKHDRWAWPEPDRRTLYRAVALLASDRVTALRTAVGLHTLLTDLEVYDDPRQGLGSWVHADEYAALDTLAQTIHTIVGTVTPADAGQHALLHPDWAVAKRDAKALLAILEANGPGRALKH